MGGEAEGEAASHPGPALHFGAMDWAEDGLVLGAVGEGKSDFEGEVAGRGEERIFAGESEAGVSADDGGAGVDVEGEHHFRWLRELYSRSW